jgi:ferredoxin
MKAFGGGNLTGDYKKALDYVTALPGVASTMIGMGRAKDVDDAIAYFSGRLPDDFVPDTSRKRLFVDRGDCEGCGACAARCTSKAIRLDEEGIAVVDNQNCVLCGYCAHVCPTRALILV